MNEQIGKLAVEAGFYANPDVEKFEKFAQLIVRECLTICQHNAEDDDDQFDLGRVHQAKEITHLIKKHFGVKE
jgi:hypothetical protein